VGAFGSYVPGEPTPRQRMGRGVGLNVDVGTLTRFRRPDLTLGDGSGVRLELGAVEPLTAAQLRSCRRAWPVPPREWTCGRPFCHGAWRRYPEPVDGGSVPPVSAPASRRERLPSAEKGEPTRRRPRAVGSKDSGAPDDPPARPYAPVVAVGWPGTGSVHVLIDVGRVPTPRSCDRLARPYSLNAPTSGGASPTPRSCHRLARREGRSGPRGPSARLHASFLRSVGPA